MLPASRDELLSLVQEYGKATALMGLYSATGQNQSYIRALHRAERVWEQIHRLAHHAEIRRQQGEAM